MSPKEPLSNSLGKTYGRLTVLEFTGEINKHGEKFVKCICDCGNEKICLLRLVRRGSTRSCGCKKLETSKENIKIGQKAQITNGKWKDPLLQTQQSIFRKYSDGDITFELFLTLSQQNCFYCNALPSNRSTCYGKSHGITAERLKNSYFIYNGLDRIDSSLGHTIANVVPCCANCNYAKLDRTQSDFFDWIKAVYNNHFTD